MSDVGTGLNGNKVYLSVKFMLCFFCPPAPLLLTVTIQCRLFQPSPLHYRRCHFNFVLGKVLVFKTRHDVSEAKELKTFELYLSKALSI